MKGHYFIEGKGLGLEVERLHWNKADAMAAMRKVHPSRWAILFQAGLFTTDPSGKVIQKGKVYVVVTKGPGSAQLRPVEPLSNYTHRK